MLSNLPLDLSKLKTDVSDRELIRLGIIAELDAISLYEQMAAKAENPKIKLVLADIAKEEKTHVGEFQALLMELDQEQAGELVKGKAEVDGLTA